MTKVRIASSDIMGAMSRRWTAPEWSIMWEVGEGTGARSGRYADAVMMSLWPSRGLELHGVEIKVSRSDWRREAADPAKAEAVARFCDRWWVHTAPGVVDDLSDVPPAWGLREWDGKAWKTLREAEKTPAEPITRTFLAALLRRADGAMRMLVAEAMREFREREAAEAQKRRDQFAADVAKAVERRTAHLQESAANVAAFEEAFGVGSAREWAINHAALGAAARRRDLIAGAFALARSKASPLPAPTSGAAGPKLRSRSAHMAENVEHKMAMEAIGFAAGMLSGQAEYLGKFIEAERSMHSYLHITDPTLYRKAIHSDSLRHQIDLAKAAVAFVLAVQKVKDEIAERTNA